MTGEGDPEVDVDPAITERYERGLALLLAGDGHEFVKVLNELAAAGVPQAQYALGDVYLHALGGVTADPAAALQWYLAAAAGEYPLAFSSLGHMYHTGIGVERSVEKALHYYKEGAKRFDAESMARCGEVLASGELGEPQHDLAIPAYWDGAQRGSALAQRRLGAYYTEGKWVERDLKLAAELYEAAARQNDEYAAYHLGLACENGNSAVTKDLAEAIRWYQVAADAGLTAAQHKLGICHAHPDNPHRDLQVAAMWFHKAADGGARASMEHLARIYALGEGVDPNLEKAAYWKDRAATAPDLDPVTGRAADPVPGTAEAAENPSFGPGPMAADQPSDSASELTEAEALQLKDMTNRIRAILREVNDQRRPLQAFLIGDLLAALLANCRVELRETMVQYVLQVARDQLPINEHMLEEAWRKEHH
jgi:TPR repeat protein